MDDHERTWYLRQVDLFRGLAPEQVEALAALLEQRSYRAGEAIIPVGRAEERVYVVRTGSVRLFHRNDEGRELTADLVGPGRLFGFSTLFGSPRDGLLAEAVSDVTLHTAEGSEFLRCVSQLPQVMLSLIVQIGTQVLQTEQQLDRLVALDARGRLATALHRLALDSGETDLNGGRRISTLVTHDALGRQIGCSRETVTRMLASLEADGFIRRQGRRIVVTDLDHLARTFGIEPAEPRPIPFPPKGAHAPSGSALLGGGKLKKGTERAACRAPRRDRYA